MLNNKISRLTLILSITAMIMMSGCAIKRTNKSALDSQAWQQHQKKLQHISQFTASGSLAYFSTKTRSYARFYLQKQDNTHYELQLSTPLGTPIMVLTVNNNQAKLQLKKDKTYYSNNVETLLNQVTGITIPVRSLHEWLIGLAPLSDAIVINENGYLKETKLKQDNITWKIAFPAYHDTMPTPLPAKIELTRQEERITLNINKWTQ